MSLRSSLAPTVEFADDITLLGSTQQSLCQLTEALEREAAKVGLRINAAKSKVLRVGYAQVHAPVFAGQRGAPLPFRWTRATPAATTPHKHRDALDTRPRKTEARSTQADMEAHVRRRSTRRWPGLARSRRGSRRQSPLARAERPMRRPAQEELILILTRALPGL